jgi:hypothetical protein
MRTLFLLVIILMLFAVSCVATGVQKCHTDHKYQGDKEVETYTECISQPAGDHPKMTLKHQEMYQ